MRNDTHDELEHIPCLRIEAREPDDFGQVATDDPSTVPDRRLPAAAPIRGARTGLLWALIGSLAIALAGLGWWGFQQLSLMEQQLVATQESFARISEEAAGRIQDISGKVVAAESSANTGSEALRLQIRQAERRLEDVARQLQAQAARLEQLEQLAGALQQQESMAGERATALDSRLNALAGEQAGLAGLKTEQDNQQARLASLDEALKQLKARRDPSADIERLEQELLVLRSELDNSAPGTMATVAEFDAFRAQTTRTLSTLQRQVRNLQRQLDGR